MSSKTEEFNKNQIGDYILNKQLGFGGFAKVVEGIHIPTGEKVAIKILDKNKLNSDPLAYKRILLEISILKNIRHKNIIKLYEVMETPQKLYLIMEYCKGGELFNYIIRKKHLSEKQSCKFFHEIIDALEYLHIQNIVHRDIKPQNILLDTLNNETTLKIIDFGISNIYSLDNLLESSCGTASYAPPEMHIGNKYFGLLTDIWSAGVVLYIMNFGYLPFCEDDEDKNIMNIINGVYEIPKEASPELKDFLKHLLDINPLTRYDFEQIKKHPWFNIVSSDSSRPGIIIGFNKIPIDENIINLCKEYGYDTNLVRQSVKNNDYNSNSSIYYILLQKLKNKGTKSISDLYSDKYLEYINDPNNLLINEQNENNNEKQKMKLDKIDNKQHEKLVDINDSKNKEKNKNEKNDILLLNSSKFKNNKKLNKSNLKKEKNLKKNSYIIENDKKMIYRNRTKLNNNKKLNISLKEKNNKNIQNNHNNISSIKKRLLPIKSNLYHSNTNIISNNINTFKDYKIEEKLNNSFHEKLSDNIKENILKLLNPKKRDKNKTKIKEELFNLKYKIKNGKSFNNNKSSKKYSNQKNKNKNSVLLKNNKLNFPKKIGDSIFKKEDEKYTVIKNRNASAENEPKRVNNKNKISKDKINNKNYRHNRKLSLSPININKNISNINTVNRYKINLSQNKTYNNCNIITRRNDKSEISEECDLLINNNGFRSKNSINIKVSKIIKNKKQKKNKAPPLLKIKKISTNDYIKDNKENINNKMKNYNYNTNHIEFNENLNRDCLTSRKEKEAYNSFYKIKLEKKSNFIYKSFNKTNKPVKKTICITLKSIKENNKSNILIYNNNINKYKYKDMLLSINLSKINNDNKNNSVHSRKSTNKKKIDNRNKRNDSSIKKNQNKKSNLMLKIKSMRNASMIINKSKKEEMTPKKRLMNISSFEHRNNKDIDNPNCSPKKYTGPLDIKSLIVSDSIKTISDEIYKILNKNKIKQCRLNPYQFCCNKNGEFFEINIYKVSGQIKNVIANDDYSKNFKGSDKSLLNKNLYYFTISVKNNFNIKLSLDVIHKMIYKKLKVNQI